MLRFIKTFRDAGDDIQNLELFATAWDECIELQVRDKDEWLDKTLRTLSRLDRFEIGLFDGARCVGGVVLAQDNDIHIGECLSVYAQYVLPEYRNKGVSSRCMRECIRIAKELSWTHLAYTHRLGDWRYETVYKAIK